jgi:hypothetical protein
MVASRRTPSAIASALRPSTSRPLTPSSIISAMPPCALPSTTRPASIASRQAFGQFSNADGSTQTSARASSAATPARDSGPTKVVFDEARDWSHARYEPPIGANGVSPPTMRSRRSGSRRNASSSGVSPLRGSTRPTNTNSSSSSRRRVVSGGAAGARIG